MTTEALIITAPVLIPQYCDCEFTIGEEPLTAEKIRKFAKEYEEYKIVDLEHTYLTNHNTVGTPIKSEILTKPTPLTLMDGSVKTYPIGTWVIYLKITCPKTIQMIQNGELKGVSATTIERTAAENLKQPISTKSQIKRILIKDIKDPVVVTISLTKKPCVRDAKFCKVNENSDNMTANNLEEQIDEQTKSFSNNLKEIFGISKKSDETGVSKEDFEEFKSTILTTLQEYKKDTDEKISALQEASVKEDKNKKEGEECSQKEDPKEEPVEGLTPEEEEELQRLLQKKKEAEAGQAQASTKSLPNHEGNIPKPQKSESAIVYGIMGRDGRGSRLKE